MRWTLHKREMSSAALSVPEQGAVGPGTSAKPAVGTTRKECHHCPWLALLTTSGCTGYPLTLASSLHVFEGLGSLTSYSMFL